jgi:hypothetical protein
MTVRHRLFAALASALIGWGLAASSGVRVRTPAASASELRLSWSARPERIETCRRLSDEELAARPAHMQQRLLCEGGAASYDLRVLVDGVVRDSAVFRGAGLRNDRSLFVLRRYPVDPGSRRVTVTFTRRERPDSAVGDDTSSRDPATQKEEPRGGAARQGADQSERQARDAREELQRQGRRLAALPPRLVLEQVVSFRAGEAVLVTVEQTNLVVRTR